MTVLDVHAMKRCVPQYFYLELSTARTKEHAFLYYPASNEPSATTIPQIISQASDTGMVGGRQTKRILSLNMLQEIGIGD